VASGSANVRPIQTPIRNADTLAPQLVGNLLSIQESSNLVPTPRASVILDRGTGLQVTHPS